MKAIFQKINVDAKLPTKANDTDMGWDVYSVESKTIMPGGRVKIPTGLIWQPEMTNEEKESFICEIQVRPRSGLAYNDGVTVLNAPGTIDCFSEDCKILTINGYKNIKEISLSDVVLSVNENLEIEKKSISSIIDKGEQEVLIIETEDGILEITEDTLVYTKNGIIQAKDLKFDDEIYII